MRIERGSLVWLEYDAFLDSGEQVDSSAQNGPLRLRVGAEP
jgi:FKBP-type peptidyl-prolyl cis-trans isomerase 2